MSHQEFENHINSLFPVGESFIHDGERWSVSLSGKPKVASLKEKRYGGEGKTDVYILAVNDAGIPSEIKISVKKANADFVENKISAVRAQNLFGDKWEEILEPFLNDFADRLMNEDDYNPIEVNRKGERTIRIGYRLDIMMRKSGNLCVRGNFSRDTVREVWSGENLEPNKRDSYVQGTRIADSGIANNILVGDIKDYPDAQSVIDNMQSIDDYLDSGHGDLWLTIRAVNLRDVGKFDKARPLAIKYQYWIEDGVIIYSVDHSDPLIVNSTQHRDTIPVEVEELAFS